MVFEDMAGLKAEDISDTAYAQWRHHPVSRMFLQFMKDQTDAWRAAAMEMWEEGLLTDDGVAPDWKSDVLRGRVIAMTELRGITMDQIREFYRQKAEATESES